MEAENSRKRIIELLSTKSVAKHEVYKNTLKTFNMIKDHMQEFTLDLEKQLSDFDQKIRFSFREKGQFEMEFKVAGDLILVTMHTNVFEFPKSHAVRQNSYFKDDPMRAYSGIISIYNFLADSFKYNRLNDVGYLIGRIFINKDMHFIVEGKRQFGFLFNDLSSQVIDQNNIKIIMEAAIQYAIDFDLLVPPYNQVQTVSVQEMNNITSSISLKTGKSLGFNYKALSSDIK